MQRRDTADGYYEVYVPNNPMSKKRCGWLLEHRHIMSEHLGRSLTSDEIIHHKDENKKNNNLDNLELTNRSDHARGHEDQQCFTQCLQCGKTFKIKPCLPNKDRGKFCSKACGSLSYRKVERPSKERLIIDLNTMPYTKVGIKYGVSDNAVRKWAKIYEII